MFIITDIIQAYKSTELEKKHIYLLVWFYLIYERIKQLKDYLRHWGKKKQKIRLNPSKPLRKSFDLFSVPKQLRLLRTDQVYIFIICSLAKRYISQPHIIDFIIGV